MAPLTPHGRGRARGDEREDLSTDEEELQKAAAMARGQAWGDNRKIGRQGGKAGKAATKATKERCAPGAKQAAEEDDDDENFWQASPPARRRSPRPTPSPVERKPGFVSFSC